MPTDSAILAPLADDFLARLRRGEQPAIDEYAAAHPELADRIRQLFPTLLLLEGLAAHPDRTADHLPTEPDADISGRAFGPYRLVREIGRGGMGVVYEAEHEGLKRRVALKLLTVAGANAGSRLERFFREAQIAAGLHHTNIVPVFDVGQVGGRPYYAMQYISGRSLESVPLAPRVVGKATPHPSPATPSPTSPSRGEVLEPLPRSEASANEVKPSSTSPLEGEVGSSRGATEPGRGSPRTPPNYIQIAHLGRQAALALAYAHTRGVIHRDIKPANLILDDQGTLWITDFGLARRLDDATLTADGQLVGTPRYMSPEQAAAATNPIDHRTDLYSLGVTLYELLVGRPAHDGQTPPEVVNQILTRTPPPPRTLNPTVPRDLETVVLKAMSRRPADRYQSAQELADDLGRFASGEPVRARRIGVLGRTWRWAKREPKVASLIAAVVLTLAAGVVGTGWFAVRADDQRSQLVAVLSEASDGMARLESGKGEEFKALLWLTEPLQHRDVPRIEVDAIRRQVSTFMRYVPAVSHADGNRRLSVIAHPLIAECGEKDPIWYTSTWSVGEFVYVGGVDPYGGMWREEQDVDGRPVRRYYKLNGYCHRRSGETVGVRGKAIAWFEERLPTVDEEQNLAVQPKKKSWDTRVDRIRSYNSETWQIEMNGKILSPNSITEISTDNIFPGLTSISAHFISSDQYFVAEFVDSWSSLNGDSTICLILYDLSPFTMSLGEMIRVAELLACHRLDRGRYVPLSFDEARAGWQALNAAYPDVFTIPTDDLLAWHLKGDDASVNQKHRHAALIAANFACRDRPTEPHPFVARGRLFTVLGDFDKAEADFTTGWKLGGTGWIRYECGRLVREAVRTTDDEDKKRPEVEIAFRKLQLAATYLEQDPKTMASLLVGTPPAHRVALAAAKLRLGLPLEKNDTDALAGLIRLPRW